MSDTPSCCDLSRVSVIVPALNEAQSLSTLLPILQSLSVGRVIVADNGSTDDTRQVVESHRAVWVYEPRRGYGAACHAGIEWVDVHGLKSRSRRDPEPGTPAAPTEESKTPEPHRSPSHDVIVFLDADLSDDPALLPTLVEPILENECDFVVSTRVKRLRQPGTMTLPQRFANGLFPRLMAAGWGYRYTDMGPFRAIRRSSLEAIDMQDRAFGWTLEMQIRAVELGLRIREIPVPYRKRVGTSKISGTVRGVVLAAYWIVRTCAVLWLTKRRRTRLDARPPKTFK